MTITAFAFVPPNGIRDASYAPTDPPNEAALRQAIQGIPDQLKDYINNVLLTSLASTTTSSSGAREIGSETLPGIVGNTVYAQLLALLNYINSISIGNVPINSITNDKLGTDVKVGSLASLTTTDKTSVVNAINETNTASNMLDKLKTVDGSGSGLDADLLDGINANEFSTPRLEVTNLNAAIYQGSYFSLSNAVNAPFADEAAIITVSLTGGGGISQIAISLSGLKIAQRTFGGISWSAWRPIVLDNPTVTTITTGFASGWSGSIVAEKNLNNVLTNLSFNFTKSSDIANEQVLLYTLPVGVRPKNEIKITVNLFDSNSFNLANSQAIITIFPTGGIFILPIASTNLTNARKIIGGSSTYYSV